MGNNKNKKRKKIKRNFHGNRYTNQSNITANVTGQSTENVSTSSVSSSKIFVEEVDHSASTDNYNIVINFSILKKIVQNICSCPDCDSGIIFTDENSKRSGFSHKLFFKCPRCTFEYSTFTSEEVVINSKRGKQGRNFFDTNLKMVIAFREIGKGHRAIEDFSRLANMACMNVNAFENINTTVQEAYKLSAEESTQAAAMKVAEKAKEEHAASGKKVVTVSTDGAWQKRGHASLNGVVTTISEGMCLDFNVLSKYCRGCQMWNNKENQTGYSEWKANHICSLNHTGSSGAMESSGAVEIFSRSVLKNDLIYKYYLGDGDSSSFNDVVRSKPYEA